MAGRRARHAGGGRVSDRGPLAGWPTGEHDPLTPAGEHEQVLKLLSGLSGQRGWRRVAARLAAVLALLIIAAVVLAGLLHVVA